MTKSEIIECLKYKPYWRSIHRADIYSGIIYDLLEYIGDKDIKVAFKYLDRMIRPYMVQCDEMKEEEEEE